MLSNSDAKDPHTHFFYIFRCLARVAIYKLLDDSENDRFTKGTGAVAISPNKKKRWELPNVVSDFVHSAKESNSLADVHITLKQSDLCYEIDFPGLKSGYRPPGQCSKLQQDNNHDRRVTKSKSSKRRKPSYTSILNLFVDENEAFTNDLSEAEYFDAVSEERAKRTNATFGDYLRVSPNSSRLREIEDCKPIVAETKLSTGETKIGHFSETAVLLNNVETTCSNLRAQFGSDIIFCSCYPRKFIVNITKEVECYLHQYLPTSWTLSNGVCLLFVQDVNDRSNDANNSVYNVDIKSDLKLGLSIRRSEKPPLTTVAGVISNVFKQLDYRQVKYRHSDTQASVQNTGKVVRGVLGETLRNSTTAHVVDTHYLLNFVVAREGSLKLTSEFSETDMFVLPTAENICSICTEANQATTLRSCKHSFCNNCLKEYITMAIRTRCHSVQCPEYGCDCVLDAGTLMSLVDFVDSIRYVGILHDKFVTERTDWLWCPNTNCGRALQYESDNTGLCYCVCGEKICPRCKDVAHWPASCKPYRNFSQKLQESGDIKHFKDIPYTVTYSNGKECPKCQWIIEKDGGCPRVICSICKETFCWGCGQPYANFSHSNCSRVGAVDDHDTNKFAMSSHDLDHLQLGEWYTFALRHHHYRRPPQIAKLKAALKPAVRPIQRFFLNKTCSGVCIESDDLVQNAVDFYIEAAQLIECTAVFINTNKEETENVKILQKEVKGMAIVTENYRHAITAAVSENVNDSSQLLVKELAGLKNEFVKKLRDFVGMVSTVRTDSDRKKGHGSAC